MHRSAGRRRTVEQEQERESRLQLALAWKSWPLQSSVEDLGEDLLFQVYADGNFTGLSFYVQLKSTTSLDALVPKRRTDSVAYTFETKDLRHWEDSVPPVVLVIWDVQKKIGVWHDVPEVLKSLDKSGKSWRSKKTVRVLLPRKRTTGDAGRDALRGTLAHLALPVLSHGKTTTITPTFSFPKTPEGRALLEALRTTLDEGGSVTIPQENIAEFRMSDWWERAYGVRVPEFVTISSSAASITLPLRLQAVGADRTESISLDLRRTKAGRKRATFETVDGVTPVRAKLVLHVPGEDEAEAKLELKVAFEHPCESVDDSLCLTRFLVVARQGGAIRLVLPNGAALGELKLDLGERLSLNNLVRWERVLLKLSYIQPRVDRFGRFSVTKLSNRDIPTIERLHTILQKGTLSGRMSFGTTFSKPPTLPEHKDATKPEALTIKINPFGEEKLLGVRVPLGEVLVEFQEPEALLGQMRAVAAGRRKSLRVSVKDTPVVRHYLDWVLPKNGPERIPKVVKRRKAKKRRRR